MSHRSRKEESVRRPEIDLALVRANASQAIFPPPITPNILTQTALFIDPVAGNDASIGLSPSTALKTWREYWRRMCVASAPFNAVSLIGVQQIVTFLNDQPNDSDPVVREIYLGSNAQHTIQGSFVVERTSTFTAFADHVLGTNTAILATDSALPAANSWTVDVGKPIRDNTVAGQPIAWVEHDNGAKQARLSQTFAQLPVGGSVDSFAAMVPFANGNSYSVGHYTRILYAKDTVYGLSVDASIGFGQNCGYVRNVNASLPVDGVGNENVSITTEASANVFLIESRFDAFIVSHGAGVISTQNCWFNGIAASGGVDVQAVGGVITGEASVVNGSALNLDGNLVLDGGSIAQAALAGTLTLSLVALHDGAQVLLGPFGAIVGYVVFQPFAYGTKSIWGTTTANPTFSLGSGSLFKNETPNSTVADIPIVGANFTLDGATTALPQNPATGAYSAAQPCTIAKLQATIAGGGFGGTAREIGSGAAWVI